MTIEKLCLMNKLDVAFFCSIILNKQFIGYLFIFDDNFYFLYKLSKITINNSALFCIII